MELGMKAIGKMIFSMAMERKFGQITLSMKENIMKAKSMVKVHMYGLMEVCTREIGLRIVLRDMELILG
jgi:hypothetical protein